jgi:hypothetical protein
MLACKQTTEHFATAAAAMVKSDRRVFPTYQSTTQNRKEHRDSQH